MKSKHCLVTGLLLVVLLLSGFQTAIAQDLAASVGKWTLKDLLSAPTTMTCEGAQLSLQGKAARILESDTAVPDHLIVCTRIIERLQNPVPSSVTPDFLWVIQEGRILCMKDLRMLSYEPGLPPHMKGKPAKFGDVLVRRKFPTDIVVAISTKNPIEGRKLLKLAKPIEVFFYCNVKKVNWFGRN